MDIIYDNHRFQTVLFPSIYILRRFIWFFIPKNIYSSVDISYIDLAWLTVGFWKKIEFFFDVSCFFFRRFPYCTHFSVLCPHILASVHEFARKFICANIYTNQGWMKSHTHLPHQLVWSTCIMFPTCFSIYICCHE